MGVSIFVEWPGITDEQKSNQPGFYNDDPWWANWMVEVVGKPKLCSLLKGLGGEVLLFHNTTHLPLNKIGWASPDEFETAANTLIKLLDTKDVRFLPLLEIYKKEWDRLIGENEGETAEDWFKRDLHDVAEIARYARTQGAQVMTLGYYW